MKIFVAYEQICQPYRSRATTFQDTKELSRNFPITLSFPLACVLFHMRLSHRGCDPQVNIDSGYGQGRIS